jgi:hypothetical protein
MNGSNQWPSAKDIGRYCQEHPPAYDLELADGMAGIADVAVGTGWEQA